MKDFTDASYDEVVGANPFELQDSELKSLLERLSKHRIQQLKSVTPSVNTLNQQIELAQFELSSRQTQRMARVSLLIATIAIAVSVVGAVF